MKQIDSVTRASDPLIKKYQPQTIDDFVGNVNILNTLTAVLNNSRRNRGYVISGPYGTGKTTLSWAIAKHVGADDGDINFAPLRDYKDLKRMRRVIDAFHYRPHGLARVFIFDEAHNLPKRIQEEILKYLDNPPRTLHLIFCTSELKRVIVPLQQRCFQVALQPLEFKDRMKLLRRICKGEQIDLDRPVLKQIARESEGIPRKLVNGLLAEIALVRKTSDPVRTAKVKVRAAN